MIQTSQTSEKDKPLKLRSYGDIQICLLLLLLIIVKKLNSLKHLVRTTVAELHN